MYSSTRGIRLACGSLGLLVPVTAPPMDRKRSATEDPQISGAAKRHGAEAHRCNEDAGSDQESEAEEARVAEVMRIRQAVTSATAAEVVALDESLKARFYATLTTSIEEGGCTDTLLDLITTTPALLRSTTPDTDGSQRRTPVELCCVRRTQRARLCMEELLEFGAQATDPAYELIIDALRYGEGGGSDCFASLAKSGQLPLELGGEKILDLLCALPDEYFAEMVFPDFVMRLRREGGEGERLSAIEKASLERLPRIEAGVTHAPDGPFARWTPPEQGSGSESESGQEDPE